MSKNSDKTSPALQLVRHVCKYHSHQMSYSQLRCQQAPRGALRLAIKFGLRFDKTDFGEKGLYGDEWDYKLAVAHDRHGCQNRSACIAYENWKKRKPFIAPCGYQGALHRLAVGSRFTWRGQCVEVTSFADDGAYIIACVYKYPNKDDYRRKVERRYKITRKDLLSLRKSTETNKGRT